MKGTGTFMAFFERKVPFMAPPAPASETWWRRPGARSLAFTVGEFRGETLL
jgi:hypothetical protein